MKSPSPSPEGFALPLPQALEPLKATLLTAYGKIFVVSILLGPLYLIALLWLAGRVLSPDDVEFFRAACSTLLALVASGSGLATVKGSLMKTAGKIAAQAATQQAQAALPAEAAPILAPLADGDIKDAKDAALDLSYDKAQKQISEVASSMGARLGVRLGVGSPDPLPTFAEVVR